MDGLARNGNFGLGRNAAEDSVASADGKLQDNYMIGPGKYAYESLYNWPSEPPREQTVRRTFRWTTTCLCSLGLDVGPVENPGRRC